MNHWLALLCLVCVSPAAADDMPLAGCYERVYDKAFLGHHPGQIVERVTLKIKTPQTQGQAGFSEIVADAELKIFVRATKESFDSTGACSKAGDGLICGGSVSAAETDICKSRADGIRNCRISLDAGGEFHIAPKPDGVLLTITKQTELLHAPYDGVPVLYLSPGNTENHTFLLKGAACR